jgi:hypothetical protein
MKAACHRTWESSQNTNASPTCTTASINSSLPLEKRTCYGVLRKFARADCELCHVFPSVGREQFGPIWMYFHEMLHLSTFRNNLENICHENLTRIAGTLNEYQFLTYVAQFFLEWEMFHTKVVEKINTYFMFSNFFSENRNVYVWKNTEQTTDDMRHALFMLYTYC